MCLTIPGRVISIEGAGTDVRTAVVDYGSVQRTVHLMFLPEAAVGDYVIVQSGFAMTRLDESEALEALAYANELSARSTAARPPLNVPTPVEGSE
jgi:hydrogenase expression/formation protein HypC